MALGSRKQRNPKDKKPELWMNCGEWAPIKSPTLWLKKLGGVFPIMYFRKPKWLSEELWKKLVEEVQLSIRVSEGLLREMLKEWEDEDKED